MAHSRSTKQVALAFPVAVPWMALCMRGIIDYAQQHGGWNLLASPPTLIGAQEITLTTACLKGWPGDGVIAFINDRQEANDSRRLDIPLVSLGGVLRDPRLPRVMVDNYAIGRLAADHLLQCGFRRLGFYGFRGPWYTAERRRGFTDRAAEAGIRCATLEQPVPSKARSSWQQRLAPLDRWLETLKPPLGIFAVHDYRARILVEECLRLGLDVPHEVAVIGVDNDTTVCDYCQPTLSSVSRNAWRHGYEAAALLDQLMAGNSPRTLEIVVPPDGVVARGSTDTIAVDDPHVRTAVHFMRDHLEEPLGVEQLLSRVSISRRLLEKRFQQFLQCTPHAYLCRLRVEKAKRLLASSKSLKIHSIAKACGFASQDRMRLVFLRLLGVTPQEYRKGFLAGVGPSQSS